MIRKIIFYSLAVFAAAMSGVSAQCTPDTSLKSTGYTPDTLQHASVGVAYSQSVSVRTPHDTSVVFNGSAVSARVDSIKATNVKGLPAGITYKCQHPRCVFLWDTTRCVEIYGTTNQGGVFPIKIMVTYYAFIENTFHYALKDSIEKFTLIVDGQTNLIFDHTKPGNAVFPNPVSGKLYLAGNSASAESEIVVTDLNGKKQRVPVNHENDIWVIDLKGLSAGVYLVRTGAGVQRIQVAGE